MARSVLRVADQAAGRFPEQCVLSGERTGHAVRLTATQWEGPRWLLGAPGFAFVVSRLPGHARCPVALPVTPAIWKRWRRRSLLALAVVVVGVVDVVVGAVRGLGSLVGLGVVVAIAGAAHLTRTAHNHWVTCRFRPSEQTIIVEPTHPAFDAAARDLFLRSLR